MRRRYQFNVKRRWQPRESRRGWWVAAIAIPLGLSLGVHGVLAVVARTYAWFEAPKPRLTDTPATETQLSLGSLPEPAESPVVVPPAAKEELPVEKPPEESKPPVPEPAAVPDPEPAKSAELTTAPISKPAPPITALLPSPAPSVTPAPPVEAPKLVTPVPKATFAGVKAERAERVVYVVDASGAMTTSLSFVLDELARSIGRLDDSQQFQVILFREPPPGSTSAAATSGFEIFLPAGARTAGLLRANDSNKDAVRAWLRTVRPLGRSAPLPGLRAALGLKPQLVFLLTRSITRSGSTPQWDEGNQTVLKTLDRLNPRDTLTGKRAVTLKTIQFLDDDPSGLLKSIAAEHGDGAGSYTLRAITDLQSSER